jgi:hypothetical protein
MVTKNDTMSLKTFQQGSAKFSKIQQKSSAFSIQQKFSKSSAKLQQNFAELKNVQQNGGRHYF